MYWSGMSNRELACAIGFALAAVIYSQAPAKSVVGTVTGFASGSPAVVVKPDVGETVTARLTPETKAQRIAPGERDLKKAEAMQVSEIANGDRVLLTVSGEPPDAVRIIVMAGNDIAKRNEMDRQDWTRRGVNGIVASRRGDEIVLKTRGMQGESQVTVTVTAKTTLKRYAPDSVKFSDAQTAKLPEVSVGDQLRARGAKSEDGLHVSAEELVFGTFVVKGGTITAMNRETKEITLKELGGKKQLVVRLTNDSQLKRMPQMPPMMGGGARGGPDGMPAGGPPGAGGRGGMPGFGGPGGMDIGQMIERMPQGSIDDLKVGETVVVSSASNGKSDHLTAILLLGNAEGLIQMAAAMSSNGRGNGGMGGPGGMGMGGGGMGDLASLGLGGIIF